MIEQKTFNKAGEGNQCTGENPMIVSGAGPERPGRTHSLPPGLPVTDSHIHLDPKGRNVEAAREFREYGGTHLILVCKPYTNPAATPTSERTILESYELTLTVAKRVRQETEVGVFVVLGPHPSEISKLIKNHSLVESEDIMKRCLDRAAGLVAEGHAVGLGEVGRPHYPCPAEVLEASNRILEHAMILGKELGVPLVLHTEGGTGVFRDLAEMASRVGFDRGKLIKHFSGPHLEPDVNHGLFPSVIARTKTTETALEKGTRFTMETDYIDVLSRPNVVLPPYQVPKLTATLLRKGIMSREEAFIIHKENIEQLYSVELEL